MPKTGVDAKKKERMDNDLKAIQELTSEERENLLDILLSRKRRRGHPCLLKNTLPSGKPNKTRSRVVKIEV